MKKSKIGRFEGFNGFLDGLVDSVVILNHLVGVYWICIIIDVHNDAYIVATYVYSGSLLKGVGKVVHKVLHETECSEYS